MKKIYLIGKGVGYLTYFYLQRKINKDHRIVFIDWEIEKKYRGVDKKFVLNRRANKLKDIVDFIISKENKRFKLVFVLSDVEAGFLDEIIAIDFNGWFQGCYGLTGEKINSSDFAIGVDKINWGGFFMTYDPRMDRKTKEVLMNIVNSEDFFHINSLDNFRKEIILCAPRYSKKDNAVRQIVSFNQKVNNVSKDDFYREVKVNSKSKVLFLSKGKSLIESDAWKYCYKVCPERVNYIDKSVFPDKFIIRSLVNKERKETGLLGYLSSKVKPYYCLNNKLDKFVDKYKNLKLLTFFIDGVDSSQVELAEKARCYFDKKYRVIVFGHKKNFESVYFGGDTFYKEDLLPNIAVKSNCVVTKNVKFGIVGSLFNNKVVDSTNIDGIDDLLIAINYSEKNIYDFSYDLRHEYLKSYACDGKFVLKNENGSFFQEFTGV